MATIIPNEERLLLAPDHLELADYLMGMYLGELEMVVTGALEALNGHDFDERDLFEVLRFAADALHDADSIREQANELERLVLAEINGRWTPSGTGDSAFLAYEERIRAWHAERVAADGV